MSMQDRENAFENKYAHDQEVKFKVEARARKLLSVWAAEQLGLSGDEAAEYRADLMDGAFEGVSGKIHADFQGKNVNLSANQIEAMIDSKLEEAQAQIEAES